jgi:hypothetical protein
MVAKTILVILSFGRAMPAVAQSIVKTLVWAMRTTNDDALNTPLDDVQEFRICASFVGPDAFETGPAGANLMTTIPALTCAPTEGMTQTNEVTSTGEFTGNDVWIRMTSVDDDGNEGCRQSIVQFFWRPAVRQGFGVLAPRFP